MCSLGRVLDTIEPGERTVLGWKTWKLEKELAEGVILRSAVRRNYWPDAAIEADAPIRAHDDDRSGIHAWGEARRPRFGRPAPEEVVTGMVALEGRVVVHERGFRAERATILSLELRPCGWHGDLNGYCACTHGPYLSADELEDVRQALQRRYDCLVRLMVAADGPTPRRPDGLRGRPAGVREQTRLLAENAGRR